MNRSLKYARETVSSVKWLISRHEHFEKEFVRLMGQVACEQTKKFYSEIIAKLIEEMQQLPVGYRYTGEFYLKGFSDKHYFWIKKKVEGSAFVREDLVSWQIESTDPSKKHRYAGYHKAIYKEPDLKTEITKADAIPVYAATKDVTADAI